MDSNKKKDCIKLFNTAVKDIINDFITVYPDDTSLKAMRIVYKTLKKINRKLPQESFHNYIVSKYEKEIVNRNDEYIIKSLRDDIANNPSSDVITNMMRQVQETIFTKWNMMSQDQKHTIWQHMDLLLKINKVCQSL